MLHFEIDKLTNSIEHAATGEIFETLVLPLEALKLKSLGVRKWVFNWKKEFNPKDQLNYTLSNINRCKNSGWKQNVY